MTYSDNDPCHHCEHPIKLRRHLPSWKPKPNQQFWFKVWYACKNSHIYTNESDKVHRNQAKVEGPVQPTLMKSKPGPLKHEPRRRKCWICKHRFRSYDGDELCDACIEKFGEQKVKASPRASIIKSAQTASERAKSRAGTRAWLQNLRIAHKKSDRVEKHCQSRAIRRQMESQR